MFLLSHLIRQNVCLQTPIGVCYVLTFRFRVKKRTESDYKEKDKVELSCSNDLITTETCTFSNKLQYTYEV